MCKREGTILIQFYSVHMFCKAGERESLWQPTCGKNVIWRQQPVSKGQNPWARDGASWGICCDGKGAAGLSSAWRWVGGGRQKEERSLVCKNYKKTKNAGIEVPLLAKRRSYRILPNKRFAI